MASDETWLHSLVESIDHRLELLNTKVDAALANMTTKTFCQRDCDIRKNAVDKRYFLGWGSCMIAAGLIINLAFRFT